MPSVTLPEYDNQRYLEYRPDHRTALVRRTALLGVMGLIATPLFIVAVLNLPNSWIAALIFGVMAFSADMEVLSALRDLRARPVTTVGRVGKTWRKGRFLFFGSIFYVMVNGRLFELGPVAAHELQRGDEVSIYHWPHTNQIITLERTRRHSEFGE